MADNVLGEMANEYRRLQRLVESKTQQLNSLLAVGGRAGDFPTDFDGARNRRYSIDFQFTPGVLEPQELGVQIETGTIFRCAYVESFVVGVGSPDDPYSAEPVTVQAALPWSDRLQYFDYFWRIRDTGTDREWVNSPQPSLFLGGGYVGPLWLPRRTVLGGGTVIVGTIDPIISSTVALTGTFFGAGTINSYIVQMSFVGHEVPDGSVL